MIKLIQTYGTIFGIVVALFSAYFAIDAHYAKAAEVNKISLRLEQKILQDQQERLQERIWKIEDRYTGKPMSPEAIEQLRKLKLDQQQIDRDLATITRRTLGE